jgi:hypothetical protein
MYKELFCIQYWGRVIGRDIRMTGSDIRETGCGISVTGCGNKVDWFMVPD